MAIAKSIDTPLGVQATYWRLMERRESYDSVVPTVTFTLGGYATQAASDAGAQPLVVRTYQMPLRNGQTFDNIGRSDAYTFLSSEDEPKAARALDGLFAGTTEA